MSPDSVVLILKFHKESSLCTGASSDSRLVLCFVSCEENPQKTKPPCPLFPSKPAFLFFPFFCIFPSLLRSSLLSVFCSFFHPSRFSCCNSVLMLRMRASVIGEKCNTGIFILSGSDTRGGRGLDECTLGPCGEEKSKGGLIIWHLRCAAPLGNNMLFVPARVFS